MSAPKDPLIEVLAHQLLAIRDQCDAALKLLARVGGFEAAPVAGEAMSDEDLERKLTDPPVFGKKKPTVESHEDGGTET